MIGVAIEFDLEIPAVLGLSLEKIERAQQRAINKTVDRARTMAAKAVQQQVRFPASYLSPSGGRLTVAQRASKGNLEAIVRGRDRPTSLARFARGKGNSKGILVSVKGRNDARISRAFIVTLRNGNIGFAVRTEGGPPKGAYKPGKLGENLWLLYGPSVQQVLSGVKNNGGVYEQISEEVQEFAAAEFLRLLELEAGGANG